MPKSQRGYVVTPHDKRRLLRVGVIGIAGAVCQNFFVDRQRRIFRQLERPLRQRTIGTENFTSRMFTVGFATESNTPVTLEIPDIPGFGMGWRFVTGKPMPIKKLELKPELQLPPMRSEVVVTLHGLGRTRKSMAGIGRSSRTRVEHASSNPSMPICSARRTQTA